MIDSPLSEGKKVLHSIDPRLKIVLLFFYSFIVALEKNPRILLYASILPLLFLCGMRDSFRIIIKRMLPVNGFILLLWLFIPFTFPGEIISRVGSLSITREGIFYCLIITWKSNLIFLASLLFLSTSPVFHLVHALHHLRLPSKLVQLFYFTYRYIPVIYGEYNRLREAMRVRGFKPGNNLHTLRTTGYLVGMLLLRSQERSERVYQAMLARGFQGIFWNFHHFAWKRKDTLFLVIFILYFMGLGWVKWSLS